ncbi:MAG: FlgD immunoglobulin-like domain containing protein, partial [bacterium]
LETESGALIAGGFVVYDPGSWAGVIYRSENGGASWDARLTYPQGTISEVIQAGDGSLWAVTGWNGEILRSTDDGLSWSTAAALGGGVIIHDIIQTALGDFLVALEGESSGSPVMKSRNGTEWSAMEGLDEVTAAYDLVTRGDEALVAVTESGRGAVYMAAIAGMGWGRLPDLPADDVVAVRSLAVGPGGRVVAGVERAWGPSDTYVFVLPTDRGPWVEFGGMIDLATGVYRMATTETDVYAATGWVYGNVYRCSFDALTGVDDEVPAPPVGFNVGSSYPNPFNPETVIPYHLASPERVTVAIYDVNGRLVRTIKADMPESPGWHHAVWDGLDDNGNDAASGVYFYRLTAGRYGGTGKLTLVR